MQAPAGAGGVAVNGPKPVQLVYPPFLAAKRLPQVTRLVKASENLLSPFSFNPFAQGFERQRETFFCDNGDNAKSAGESRNRSSSTRLKPSRFLPWPTARQKG